MISWGLLTRKEYLVYGRIKLAVVSEPDDDDGECEDVGKAYVSVRDILRTEQDLIDQDVDSKRRAWLRLRLEPHTQIFFSPDLFYKY